MRFVKFMHIYEKTLSTAAGLLFGAGLIYIILLLAYAQLGYLVSSTSSTIFLLPSSYNWNEEQDSKIDYIFVIILKIILHSSQVLATSTCINRPLLEY